MKEFWDKRYAEVDYAYGEEPNIFFKEQLDQLSPGRIMLPADGEGRNGVYAAAKGWEVDAFDISKSGRQKAIELAKLKGVSINYDVGPLAQHSYAPDSYDVVALIFAHFPAHLKLHYHQEFEKLLKPGGLIIFEAFSKDHLEYSAKNPKVGGPKNVDILYNLEEIKEYFDTLEVELITQTEVELSEGEFHQGTGSVVRYVGHKG